MPGSTLRTHMHALYETPRIRPYHFIHTVCLAAPVAAESQAPARCPPNEGCFKGPYGEFSSSWRFHMCGYRLVQAHHGLQLVLQKGKAHEQVALAAGGNVLGVAKSLMQAEAEHPSLQHIQIRFVERLVRIEHKREVGMIGANSCHAFERRFWLIFPCRYTPPQGVPWRAPLPRTLPHRDHPVPFQRWSRR